MVESHSSAAPQVKICGKQNNLDVSYDRVMAKPNLVDMEAPLRLSELANQSSQAVNKAFTVLERMAAKPRITEFRDQDIYCDVHPFEETAIHLGLESDDPAERYINANRIVSIYGEELEQNLIIATQGPKNNTCRAFWKMVVQENVGRIVTLVQKIPGDCSVYFPGKGKTAEYGEMKVTVISESSEGDFITLRTIEVTDTRRALTRMVMHFHFRAWEDWHLPSGPSRENLATLIDQTADYVYANARKQGSERERLLVHCRAGIGRTGTTIALIHASIAVKEQLAAGVAEPTLSFFSIVRRLREQRIWMVQTSDQFAYLFEFLRSSKWLQGQR